MKHFIVESVEAGIICEGERPEEGTSTDSASNIEGCVETGAANCFGVVVVGGREQSE